MSINKQIDFLMNKALSGEDVIRLTGDPDTNIISYVDIHKIPDLDTLLGKTRSCIILYEWKKNYGHWICVFEDPQHKIEVFDSYGIYKPDDELTFIPKDFAKQHNENYPYLTKLLYNSGYPIVYNDNMYQNLKDKKISTCGRYAGTRIFFRNLNLKQFNKIFKKYKKIKPDKLITIISELIFSSLDL